MALTNGTNVGVLVDGDIGEEHYEALMAQWRALDALLMPVVVSAVTTNEPGVPSNGQLYALTASAAGAAWAGNDHKLARWSFKEAAWEFYTPKEGWEIYAQDTNSVYRFDGSVWRPIYRIISGVPVPASVVRSQGLQAATSIASLTNVTLLSQSIPEIAAGDVIELEIEGIIVNDSGNSRAYTFSISLGSFTFTKTISGVNASANGHSLHFRVVFAVRSATDVAVLFWERFATAPTAAGATDTAPTRAGWDASTAIDVTGTRIAAVNVLSDSASATQTFRTVRARIERQKEAT